MSRLSTLTLPLLAAFFAAFFILFRFGFLTHKEPPDRREHNTRFGKAGIPVSARYQFATDQLATIANRSPCRDASQFPPAPCAQAWPGTGKPVMCKKGAMVPLILAHVRELTPPPPSSVVPVPIPEIRLGAPA